MAKPKRHASKPTPIRIERLSDDPICLRASIGGKAGTGFYLTYRGDEHEVLACIEAVAGAFRQAIRTGALGAPRN